MIKMIQKFPWFEVALIGGLTLALLLKPQTEALSATADSGNPFMPIPIGAHR